MLLAKTSNHRFLAPMLRKPDLMVTEELNTTRLLSLCATVRGVHTHTPNCVLSGQISPWAQREYTHIHAVA